MQIFDALPFMFFLSIPIVAIVGGITMGIIRTLSRQRLVELAQKERIAAIERGVDPAKLPPIEIPPGLLGKREKMTFEQKAMKRSHDLMISGLVLTGFGFAVSIMIGVMEPEPGSWAPGLLFVFIGIALMISSRVGRPSAEEVQKSLDRKEPNGVAA